MFRLFKILIVALLLAGIYFYLQHTPLITTTWPRTQLDNSFSLAFPGEVRHHTRTVGSALFGRTRLDVYDLIDHTQAYICLRIQPQHRQALHSNLEQLLAEIRRLNDTATAQLTLKKEFIYLGYPTFEYQAQEKSQRLSVRLVKVDDAIISLMYVVKDQELDERQAAIFFNSLLR